MTIHGNVRGPDRHPPLDEVAAFVDGRLAGDERRRMVEHLAHCDDCHELMTETVLLLRESADSTETGDGDGTVDEDTDAPAVEGKVLRPPPGRFRRALPLIAALAAAAVVALLVWTPAGERILRRDRPPVSVASLTDTLPVADPDLAAALQDFDGHGWPILLGGEPTPTEAETAAFQAGVRITELRAAITAGDRTTAEFLTHRIEDPLAALDASPFVGTGDIREGLRTGAPAAELLNRTAEVDDLLAPDSATRSPGYADATSYGLGKWAGSGRLAVAAGRLDWFDERGPRRALRQLRRADLPSDVAEPFSAITAILDAGPAEADLPLLREAFGTLIRRAGGGRDPEPDPGP